MSTTALEILREFAPFTEFSHAFRELTGSRVVLHAEPPAANKAIPLRARGRVIAWLGLDCDAAGREPGSPSPHGAREALLRAFASVLSEASERLLPGTHGSGQRQINRAKKYIDENATEPMRLADAARVAGMSANYFSSVFRRATGLTFTNYLASRRIAMAKARLTDPAARVSETAYDVGFQSLSQFNRCFRKLTGESPSEFRRRVRAAGAATPAPLPAGRRGEDAATIGADA